MNYYKRHLGDYAKDTGHLTALEHGVYTLLLDWYYANERAIPDSLTVRIARGNPEETQTVLSEFFQKTDAGWVHNYADRVIAEYNAKADRNRASGLLGGRPKKTQTVSETNPQETLATSHKPLAISQEEEHTPPAEQDGPPACPQTEIVAAYHRILPTLRRVREWNDARRKFLRARWLEEPERQTVTWWEDFFTYVSKSDFLMGRTNGDRPFDCDLEWLIRPNNFVKVVEGKYENKAA